ncbi:hypothetical protein B0H14DRAFT_3422886 [Mycena olivaceomarginata]|nr:hypothetical protein B0H14DRAFT_3422886 [Mycena olivaceomarginata]
MSQTTPGSENNPHLVDMPLHSRKRKAPDQAVGRAVFPLGTSGSARNPFVVTDSPRKYFPLAVTGTTISIYPQLNELGSIEAHLQPSYRTAIREDPQFIEQLSQTALITRQTEVLDPFI